nr:hypothetical protein Itr_chr03CG22170 [Ipomoea trifida]
MATYNFNHGCSRKKPTTTFAQKVGHGCARDNTLRKKAELLPNKSVQPPPWSQVVVPRSSMVGRRQSSWSANNNPQPLGERRRLRVPAGLTGVTITKQIVTNTIIQLKGVTISMNQTVTSTKNLKFTSTKKQTKF